MPEEPIPTFRDNDAILSTGEVHVSSSTKKKRKKKKKKALYDQYLADSGSDSSSQPRNEESSSAYQFQEFEPGMDINILIQQTVQNIVQSVSLESYDGLLRFTDHDLICFGAAIKHNSSILSLQIRYLDVSDTSLVPLCRALESHPSVRALDLSGTRGGNATVRAVHHLVCSNPNILFVRLDDTIVNPHDAEEIRLATMYNALACPDPTNNPFHLGLLRKMSDIEEEKQKYIERLSAQPWFFPDKIRKDKNGPARSKKIGFADKIAQTRIGADVCAQFMNGRCTYGSRCKYIHPDKTVALKNAIAMTQYKLSLELDDEDAKSMRTSLYSRGCDGKVRLQSRLRPVNFSLKKKIGAPLKAQEFHFTELRSYESNGDEAPERFEERAHGTTWGRIAKAVSTIIIVCSSLLVVVH